MFHLQLPGLPGFLVRPLLKWPQTPWILASGRIRPPGSIQEIDAGRLREGAFLQGLQ
jgi:hypothetical protein